ncbi:MAG: precorrin-8X methylmutase [Thermoanaerobacterales bacterium]|nr:precorrin-8X methylmutase [Bacillota bacterium]MDI6906958.1 precorrin-8X methylmutase [Thermoanaerobacterales bacterium]
MDDAIFEMRGVTYRYPDGTPALRGVSAALRRGQRIAVLGANGAGKTTLFLHLVGVHRPNEGSVHFRGRPLSYGHRALQSLRRRVGMVFQDPDAQLFSANVYQDVSFGPLNLGLPEAEVRRRVEQALATAGIAGLAERPTHALSHGEKKRAALAGVLAMEPEVLIFDEPTAGLDPRGASEMIELLRRLRAGGKTVLFSTHDVDLAYTAADWCLVLARGRVIGQGAPTEVFRDQALLAAAGLATPWLLDLFEEARRRGWVAEGGKPPLHRGDLFKILEAGFGAGKTPPGGSVGVAAPGIAGDDETGNMLPPPEVAFRESRVYALYERPVSGDEIEAESLRRIEAEAPPHSYRPEEWSVVRRLVHTTADFGLVGMVRFAPGAVEAGIKALKRGAPVFTDANMVRAGISQTRLRRACPAYTPEHIHCLIAHPAVIAEARAAGLPRSLFAVRRARPILEGGIALIGNSPVALLELNRMIREGEASPALVVAMPVGFVHVEESKQELMELGVPYICLAGRRGGSTLAVAALHALAVLAAGDQRPTTDH